MKIFVSGANGFIGSHLVSILLKRGHTVICLVRDPRKAGRLAELGATTVAGDVSDRASMRGPMQGSDVVFHLAGWYAIGIQDKARMQAINVAGARNTLELAVELGVPKIIHTSTVAVFGNTLGKIVDETYRASQNAMASEYERTKWAAHYEVAVPLQQKGAPIIIVQPGGVSGAGDVSPFVQVIDLFLQKMPVMFGARSGITLAHVDDIAEGHVLAMEKGKAGESYVLAGPCLTYRELFQKLELLSGISAAKIWMPGWLANGMAGMMGGLEKLGVRSQFSAEGLSALADYTFWATADKAKRELGWQPRPVDEVLREMLEDRKRARG
jgi:nucleoside-diphosphate-sugar epimerase